MNINTYFRIFLQGLTKFIMMWMLRTHNLSNNIHIEWTQQNKKYLKEEIQYLLANDFIEPSQSEWSAPCILVLKPDGSYRMCTDYRNVSNLSKTDTFPIPRMDDCIDKIGIQNI